MGHNLIRPEDDRRSRNLNRAGRQDIEDLSGEEVTVAAGSGGDQVPVHHHILVHVSGAVRFGVPDEIVVCPDAAAFHQVGRGRDQPHSVFRISLISSPVSPRIVPPWGIGVSRCPLDDEAPQEAVFEVRSWGDNFGE
jgi:hypothetical protein